MSITTPQAEHPLLAAARTIDLTLDGVGGVDPLYLSTDQKATLLVELTGISARVTALRAHVMAVADDLAEETSNRSAGTWLAVETRTSRGEAIADERLGVTLRDRWHQTGDGVTAGHVTWEQAGVITRALETLPGDLDSDLVVKAEAHLIGEAGHFGPRDLTRLGRRVLEVIAPDISDAEEERLLSAEEQRARSATRLSFRPRGDGSTDLFARLPDSVASRLRVYLDASTSPRRAALDSDVDQLPLARRRGHAFCALLEHIPADGLPTHGGTPTTVMVTIDLDALRFGLGLAETSTGDVITASQARRLACTAGILPAVLHGKSELLDLGRTRRLFSPAQRKALTLRDRSCRAEGCEIPAAWCEAHHGDQPWSHGGRTDLADGLLLCSFHHHRAHDPKWDLSRSPYGDVRFVRRT